VPRKDSRAQAQNKTLFQAEKIRHTRLTCREPGTRYPVPRLSHTDETKIAQAYVHTDKGEGMTTCCGFLPLTGDGCEEASDATHVIRAPAAGTVTSHVVLTGHAQGSVKVRRLEACV
jgi:hypothetical protein